MARAKDKIRNHPIIGGRQATRKLPEKLCFKLWLERGSIRKAAEALHSEYGYLSYTGRPFTDKSVEVGAKRFVLWNQAAAKEMYEAHYGELNHPDIWLEYLWRLYNSMLSYYVPSTVQKWRELHPEIIKYGQRRSR